MWLNWSVATINATLQLLDIYRLAESKNERPRITGILTSTCTTNCVSKIRK